jgi:hypothetical protein
MMPSGNEVAAFSKEASVASYFIEAFNILGGRQVAESLPVPHETEPGLSYSYRLEFKTPSYDVPRVELSLCLVHENGLHQDIPKAVMSSYQVNRAEIQNGAQCYPPIDFESEADQRYLDEIKGTLELFKNY